MGLRQDKAKRLKALIIHAFDDLGRKRRYIEDIYIEHVCEKVQVSKVTLFKYFKDKEGLLLGWWSDWCMRNLFDSLKGTGVTPLEAKIALQTMRNERPALFNAVCASLFGRRRKSFHKEAIAALTLGYKADYHARDSWNEMTMEIQVHLLFL